MTPTEHPIRHLEERDGYIVAEALAISIALMDRMRDEDWPASNQAHMKDLLDRLVTDASAFDMIMDSARNTVEQGLKGSGSRVAATSLGESRS
jgi:hypothetical protein